MTGAAERSFTDVRRWLEDHPVPSGPSPEATRWKSEARDLGAEAVPALVESLRVEDEATRYAALMALRELGLEAYATGHGEQLSYLVTPPGQREPVRVAPERLSADEAASRGGS
jgi:hypothetical protein